MLKALEGSGGGGAGAADGGGDSVASSSKSHTNNMLEGGGGGGAAWAGAAGEDLLLAVSKAVSKAVSEVVLVSVLGEVGYRVEDIVEVGGAGCRWPDQRLADSELVRRAPDLRSPQQWLRIESYVNRRTRGHT